MAAMDHPPQPRDCNVRLLKMETLGSGAYGVVCKAMWDQRLCAAKFLHPIFFESNDPGMVTTRRKFEQECCFLNDMKHPNIVEYLGTTHDPDTGLLVLLMELGDENLTHFLEQSQQPLAYHIEVDLCHDIARALAYIHSKEIVHRDLSSNNVLLIMGKVKITDFGMSKVLDANRRMTPLTMCPGTLAYMPPEALRDPPVYSKKIDCFAFGVLQIQIMTRQFPDPGPAKQVVEDTRSPTGTTDMPVLDSERRKSHIDLIDTTHALLPTALSCLSYLEKDRPSAENLCRQLATFKEMPRYTQTMQQAQLREQNEEQAQQIHQLRQQLQILQQELQTKDQVLQNKQRQIQQLIQQVAEKQHAVDDKETQLYQLNQRLEANKQVIAEFQQNILQHQLTHKQLQETASQLRQYLRQAVEEKQARERQLQKALVQRKIIRDMKWQKESKAPQKMDRGSTASDSNMAYFNGGYSTKVYSYDPNTHKWHQLPDTPLTYSTLVMVQHILTMVGGFLSDKATNSLLSLMGEGGAMKWLPYYPPMPTARDHTAAVCSGHSLIVAGGVGNRNNRLATVEVLDTDTQQWLTARSLPHAFSLATISICGECLYLIGGNDETGKTHSVLTCSVNELLQCQTQPLAEKLQTAPDKQTTKWQKIADTPYYYSSCATLCGQLVAVGGTDGDKDTAAIFCYNPTTDSWEAMGDMPTARHLALVAILNGKMIAVGGRAGWWETETDVVEVLY